MRAIGDGTSEGRTSSPPVSTISTHAQAGPTPQRLSFAWSDGATTAPVPPPRELARSEGRGQTVSGPVLAARSASLQSDQPGTVASTATPLSNECDGDPTRSVGRRTSGNRSAGAGVLSGPASPNNAQLSPSLNPTRLTNAYMSSVDTRALATELSGMSPLSSALQLSGHRRSDPSSVRVAHVPPLVTLRGDADGSLWSVGRSGSGSDNRPEEAVHNTPSNLTRSALGSAPAEPTKAAASGRPPAQMAPAPASEEHVLPAQSAVWIKDSHHGPCLDSAPEEPLTAAAASPHSTAAVSSCADSSQCASRATGHASGAAPSMFVSTDDGVADALNDNAVRGTAAVLACASESGRRSSVLGARDSAVSLADKSPPQRADTTSRHRQSSSSATAPHAAAQSCVDAGDDGRVSPLRPPQPEGLRAVLGEHANTSASCSAAATPVRQGDAAGEPPAPTERHGAAEAPQESATAAHSSRDVTASSHADSSGGPSAATAGSPTRRLRRLVLAEERVAAPRTPVDADASKAIDGAAARGENGAVLAQRVRSLSETPVGGRMLSSAQKQALRRSSAADAGVRRSGTGVAHAGHSGTYRGASMGRNLDAHAFLNTRVLRDRPSTPLDRQFSTAASVSPSTHTSSGAGVDGRSVAEGSLPPPLASCDERAAGAPSHVRTRSRSTSGTRPAPRPQSRASSPTATGPATRRGAAAARGGRRDTTFALGGDLGSGLLFTPGDRSFASPYASPAQSFCSGSAGAVAGAPAPAAGTTAAAAPRAGSRPGSRADSSLWPAPTRAAEERALGAGGAGSGDGRRGGGSAAVAAGARAGGRSATLRPSSEDTAVSSGPVRSRAAAPLPSPPAEFASIGDAIATVAWQQRLQTPRQASSTAASTGSAPEAVRVTRSVTYAAGVPATFVPAVPRALRVHEARSTAPTPIDSVESGTASSSAGPAASSVTPVLGPSPPMFPRLRVPAGPPRGPLSLFALFGALERSTKFEDLFALLRDNATTLAPFVDRVVARARTLCPADDDGPRVLELLMYVMRHGDAHARTGEEFFSDPVNSWPLHMLHMVCCFHATATEYGYGVLVAALRRTGGIMTLGKGLFAALAVAMSADEDQLVLHTAKLALASLQVGVLMRRQQDELEPLLQNSSHRYFGLLLVNIPTYTLRTLVAEVNAGRKYSEPLSGSLGLSASAVLPPGSMASSIRPSVMTPTKPQPAAAVGGGPNSSFSVSGASAYAAQLWRPPLRELPLSEIEVTRVISPRSAIVCGHPLDLLRLDIMLTRFADFNGVKVHKDYIPAMAPENSRYYNGDKVHDILAFWESMDIELNAADLVIPVFSPVDGEVWLPETFRELPHAFAQRVAEAAFCRNQDLTYSLQHLKDGDVLLDVSTNYLPVGPLIAWPRKTISVFSAPGGRAERSVLPPPRRSQQDVALRATLGRLATVNQILRRVRQTVPQGPQQSPTQDGGLPEAAPSVPGVAADRAAPARARSDGDERAGAGESQLIDLGTTFEELGLLRVYDAATMGTGEAVRAQGPPAAAAPVGARPASPATGGARGQSTASPPSQSELAKGSAGAADAAHAALNKSSPSRPAATDAAAGAQSSAAVLAPLSSSACNESTSVLMVSATAEASSAMPDHYYGEGASAPSFYSFPALQSPVSVRSGWRGTGGPGEADGGEGEESCVTSNASSGRDASAGEEMDEPRPDSESRACPPLRGLRQVRSALADPPRVESRDEKPISEDPLSDGGEPSSALGRYGAESPATLASMEILSMPSSLQLQRPLFDPSQRTRLPAGDGATQRPHVQQQPQQHSRRDLVVMRNRFFTGVVNVYQVSPLIKYYEMQFNTVLADGAVAFALLLRAATGIQFPEHTLLMCPTVFALLELWDGYEFVSNWVKD